MIRAIAPATSALALLATAMATPAQGADRRLVERPYDPDEVVRIEAKTNIQATIEFGESELIENVAIGNSSEWQVTPNKRANLLFVKPLQARASTNMTVVTTRRTYLFDLVANPSARPLYVLRFSYPDDEKQAQTADNGPQGPNATEIAAASDPYAVVDPAELNFAWTSRGTRKLVPARIYDDGQATFLNWPAGNSVPAILVTNDEGVEGPVNYSVRGDTVVVDGVPAEIILRSGRDSATLVNQQPKKPNDDGRPDAALARAEGAE
ncbi:MAG: TrbG/VirB9 family P-type conjugative transfer protein [Novosphingobium sp.]